MKPLYIAYSPNHIPRFLIDIQLRLLEVYKVINNVHISSGNKKKNYSHYSLVSSILIIRQGPGMLNRYTQAILPEDINFADAKWYTDLTEKYENYRFNLLRVVMLAASLAPVVYMVIDLVEGITHFLFNYAVPFVIILAMLIVLSLTRKTDLFSKITLMAAVISFVYTLYAPNAGNVSLVIFYCFAPIAFQLSGTRRGVWWILLFAAASVAVFALSNLGFVPPFSTRFPSFVNVILAGIATVIISMLAYFSERQHEKEIGVMIRGILFDETTRLPNKKALLHSIKRNTDYLFSIIRIGIFSEPGLVPGPDLSEKLLLLVMEQLRLLKDKFNYSAFRLEGKEFGILLPFGSNDKEEALRKIASIRYYLLSTAKGWENTDFRLNIYIGGVLFRSGGRDRFAEMLSKADTALKTSIDKNTGATLLELS
jgi:hypothetical protein